MAKEVIIELKAKTDKIEKDVEGINKEINTLNKNVDKTAEGFEGVEKASKDTAKGVRKIGTTLKAIGIGLLLAAFTKLKEVFEQNQKVADAFNIAFESLSIAFNDFFSFLDNNVGTVVGYFKSIFEDPKQSLIDFADAFKRNIQERFESYLETLGLIGSAVKKVFSGDFKGALEDTKNKSKIPQINITASYILQSKEPQDISLREESVREINSRTATFSDGRLIELDTNDPLIYLEELNTELLTENFDIEVYEIVDDTYSNEIKH